MLHTKCLCDRLCPTSFVLKITPSSCSNWPGLQRCESRRDLNFSVKLLSLWVTNWVQQPKRLLGKKSLHKVCVCVQQSATPLMLMMRNWVSAALLLLALRLLKTCKWQKKWGKQWEKLWWPTFECGHINNCALKRCDLVYLKHAKAFRYFPEVAKNAMSCLEGY